MLGAERAPKLCDRADMPYLEACLLETLRFISHVPLAVPHATICNTVIGGKTIPKNTTVRSHVPLRFMLFADMLYHLVTY